MLGLAALCSVSAEDLQQGLAVLTNGGLLDKLEIAGCACLSAAGIRYARAVRSGSQGEWGNKTVGGVIADKGAIARTWSGDFIHLLGEVVSGFPAAVDDSTLTNEEKEKLKALCAEFFGHPATPELVRRTLVRLKIR